MLQSMTGFGSAGIETEKLAVSVEIKTLNSKFSDIYCRLPKAFSNREIEIRNWNTTRPLRKWERFAPLRIFPFRTMAGEKEVR